MVEVGILGKDKKLAKELKGIAEETLLEDIIDNHTFYEGSRLVYRGHPAMYRNAVAETMKMVQESGGLSKAFLLTRKPHWHNGFGVEVVPDLVAHNETFAKEIIYDIARHTIEGKPVIWITPVGPMGHYRVIADIMNRDTSGHEKTVEELKQRLGGKIEINPALVFAFAMDEWADKNGNIITNQPKFKEYMGGFRDDMQEQFYGLLRGDVKIPEKNLRFAANKGLRGYVPAMEDLLAKEAGVIITGGVGMIGHIMFWESTYGKLLGRKLSEKVAYIRGAPLTTETIAQNRFTSAASAPVPAYANTIGLGLICMLRDYGEKNMGKVRAVFGLDNVEEPLIWQRYIAQCMLAMHQTDPSFPATYVATMPGRYIVVENHFKPFKVQAK